VCIILHNLLIKLNDEGDPNWIIDDDCSDFDAESRVPCLESDDELMLVVPENAQKDERLQQLTTYINEIFVP
jgi:hypothetical protein